jgi:predicted protein tyrosine phosphatase
MPYQTQVIALSREGAQAYRSSEPYVVISLTDTDAEHPELEPQATLKDRLSLHFDDIYPGDRVDVWGEPRFCEMQPEDAERIAAFVRRWWSEVATIVVHCHAGLSRSTGVAAAIRQHHGLDDRDLYEIPRSPNQHCRALVVRALGGEDVANA